MTTRPASRRAAPSAADRRFAARARQARRRRIGRVALGTVAVAVLGGLGWLIGWSDVLAADEVRVDGVGEPLASEVVEAAGVPLGTPLVRIDADGIVERVSVLPEIRDVSVARSWPSAVTLEVTPRTPLAAVPDDDDTWWGVDESGVLFGAATERPDGLPVLEAGTEDDDVAAREAGVAVISGLPAEIADLVAAVRAGSAADVRLVLADDVVVRWGTADDTARKAEVLLAVMAAQEDPPAQYDVSAPEAPAVER